MELLQEAIQHMEKEQNDHDRCKVPELLEKGLSLMGKGLEEQDSSHRTSAREGRKVPIVKISRVLGDSLRMDWDPG